MIFNSPRCLQNSLNQLYDAFKIRGARGLEAMVQVHISSGSPYLELYVEFARTNEGPWRGMESTSSSWHSEVDFGCFDNNTIRDDVLPTASTCERASNMENVGGGPGDDDEENPLFTSYSPLVHMHNVDLSEEDELEFAELPHRSEAI
ncbi:hypothetical protein J1N35_034547 [Gossypium stocksii]|uniref:Uncharacterized protein n=1 Tax=Gossypium stocksii TaxID=47602 RepID=A0A9D3ZQM8_9ROSI|nr:hypothetical protein J1N35_034547 [Gossypium stocksii]